MIGREFASYFIDLCGLQPDDRVLDVGCGVGRMAVPLTEYLNPQGTYEGFDIVETGIKWCQDFITPQYPNFHFQLADIYNKSYNPTGRYSASNYQFPYPKKNFNFVFLTSVLTHILPEELENYFSEIARVLKVGGRALLTLYLLNEESRALIESAQSNIAFNYQFDQYRTISKEVPESAVAYEEEFVLQQCEKFGLTVKQPIYYGSWCGRSEFLSAQDILLVSRESV
ncbi:class I SAM-dependent methyltransferase [Phormidium sp. CCY1219]|uniref:class I SAM-dependent methyltransferase n=1 Tax=Phormidium sp. CCY1219 TaxID=2886104 RepID=UPI002D1E7BC8|nr:class I SAM-dependent methyltransferase [Phormidium sp. CCY1219]MEB3831368.1 class I SAM-dependent methyltransferase [Phormidium sp. CCY1219]